jgi:hypothetical protein
MNFVLENDHPRIDGQMDHETASAVQAHTVPLQRRHVGSPALKPLGPTGKTIEKLEDRIIGHRVPEVLAIDKPVQALHNDAKERVQRLELVVLGFTHVTLVMSGAVCSLSGRS